MSDNTGPAEGARQEAASPCVGGEPLAFACRAWSTTGMPYQPGSTHTRYCQLPAGHEGSHKHVDASERRTHYWYGPVRPYEDWAGTRFRWEATEATKRLRAKR